MNNEEILNEILENTKQVKTVVVDKVEKEKKAKAEKAEKAKSAKQKAEAKFKRYGTKLNEEDSLKFEEKLKILDMNQSQYFKKLIDFDLVGNEDLLKRQNKTIEDYKSKYEKVKREKEENYKISQNNQKNLKKNNEILKKNNELMLLDIKRLEDTIKQERAKLDNELNKSFFERLRALF